MNWDCPTIETPPKTSAADAALITSLTDPAVVKKLIEENSIVSGKGSYILPVLQNLESVVFGDGILSVDRYKSLGNYDTGRYELGNYNIRGYLVESLHDISNYRFNLLGHPLTKAVIDTIPVYKDRSLIVEAEAPFSILSALMDPMQLYMCFEEEADLLLAILYRIADATAEYIKACVKAGCRIISIADPTGTVNLVGEDYYKKFCGAAVIHLLKQCGDFLDHAVIHMCPKLSKSLTMTEMAEEHRIKLPTNPGSFIHLLNLMAEDSSIQFTGMICVHDRYPDLNRVRRLTLS